MPLHGGEMKEEGLLCWNCGRPTGIEHGVTRHDQCQNCMADLRCCRGCRHFEPGRRGQCKENIDKTIPNKEKSNFCGFFQVRQVFKGKGGLKARTDDKESRRDAFDDLFKD